MKYSMIILIYFGHEKIKIMGKFTEIRIKDRSFLLVLLADNNKGEVSFSGSRLTIKHSRTTVTRYEQNFTDYDKVYYDNLV